MKPDSDYMRCNECCQMVDGVIDGKKHIMSHARLDPDYKCIHCEHVEYEEKDMKNHMARAHRDFVMNPASNSNALKVAIYRYWTHKCFVYTFDGVLRNTMNTSNKTMKCASCSANILVDEILLHIVCAHSVDYLNVNDPDGVQRTFFPRSRVVVYDVQTQAFRMLDPAPRARAVKIEMKDDDKDMDGILAYPDTLANQPEVNSTLKKDDKEEPKVDIIALIESLIADGQAEKQAAEERMAKKSVQHRMKEVKKEPDFDDVDDRPNKKAANPIPNEARIQTRGNLKKVAKQEPVSDGEEAGPSKKVSKRGDGRTANPISNQARIMTRRDHAMAVKDEPVSDVEDTLPFINLVSRVRNQKGNNLMKVAKPEPVSDDEDALPPRRVLKKGEDRKVFTRNKKYTCGACTKTFTSFTNIHHMAMHAWSHCAEKRYGCAHCAYQALVRKDVINHMASKHRGKSTEPIDRTTELRKAAWRYWELQSFPEYFETAQLPEDVELGQCGTCAKEVAMDHLFIHIVHKHYDLNLDYGDDDGEKKRFFPEVAGRM